jgi:hypothetical protein
MRNDNARRSFPKERKARALYHNKRCSDPGGRMPPNALRVMSLTVRIGPQGKLHQPANAEISDALPSSAQRREAA